MRWLLCYKVCMALLGIGLFCLTTAYFFIGENLDGSWMKPVARKVEAEEKLPPTRYPPKKEDFLHPVSSPFQENEFEESPTNHQKKAPEIQPAVKGGKVKDRGDLLSAIRVAVDQLLADSNTAEEEDEEEVESDASSKSGRRKSYFNDDFNGELHVAPVSVNHDVSEERDDKNDDDSNDLDDDDSDDEDD